MSTSPTTSPQHCWGERLSQPSSPNESPAVSSIFSGHMDLSSEVRSNFIGAKGTPANPRLRPADQLCVMNGFGANKCEKLPPSEVQDTYRPSGSTLKPLFGKTRSMDLWGNGYGMK